MFLHKSVDLDYPLSFLIPFVCNLTILSSVNDIASDRNRSVGIATGYGLND
jgi:hypothetical protein